ncbi:Bestrophin/UPF0187 [Gracilaria domingensis]|nr:Bestrophin/UPF0187 [Gracilaria domingensis]
MAAPPEPQQPESRLPDPQPMNEGNPQSHPHASALTAPARTSPDLSAEMDPDNPSSHSEPSLRAVGYQSFSHRALALRLRNAQVSGELGSGPPEISQAEYSSFYAVLTTVPYTILAFQLVWSTIVTLIGYGLANKELDWFTTEFWTSRLSVSSSVSYGVGWALFVLLGFFIREASNRYFEAQVHWTYIGGNLRQTARQFRQNYPQGTWHDGDISRIAAHLIAYPIALKMALRGERERAQLEGILHDNDLDDVLDADMMHCHCMRVVRAYSSAAEDDGHAFADVPVDKTPAGWGIRYLLLDLMDAVDSRANNLVKIAKSSPSLGYVTHLQIFLYIWMFFLPLALVKSSGWFTILWAVLTTYGVGMLFTIGEALSDPFGFDMQDVKLNHLAAGTALTVLDAHFRDKLDFESLIRTEHDTPSWLEAPLQSQNDEKQSPRSLLRRLLAVRIGQLSKGVLLYLVVVIAWSSFVLFFTWDQRNENVDGECRWWCIYVPVDSSITSYVSLGIFLILGFWLNDAYGRYWQALQLWQSKIRVGIEELAFQLAMACKRGLWHERDRERLLSHVAALAFAAKLKLRFSRDTEELNDILSAQDKAAFDEADDLFAHGIDVVFAYLNTADCAHAHLTQVNESPMTASVYNMGYTIWELEGAMAHCVALRKFPMCESFTTHLKVFTFFWLALLPLSLVSFNGFLAFLYIIPISYSVINLINIGSNLSDPFGFDREDIPLDILCQEIRTSIHGVYHATRNGTRAFVHECEYSRDTFKAKDEQETNVILEGGMKTPQLNFFKRIWKYLQSKNEDVNPSFLGSVLKVFNSLPSVSARSMILATAWTVVAVFASYGLSFAWDRMKRDTCNAWCSPLDVEVSVLANIGFALFMILSFRASDAIGRYEEGAMLIFDMEMHLRNLAIEMVQSFHDGFFHPKDKERIVAHIVQVPLCFRDTLLEMEKYRVLENHGLLSEEDHRALNSSRNCINHVLNTIEAYVLLQDSTDRFEHPDIPNKRATVSVTYAMIARVKLIRETISRALGVKRFPVIASYTKHQHLFTVLWLLLLRFAMTPITGFFTILWAPLISFGVLGLEEIAAKLVDPYGKDAIDIPFENMCVHAASSVIQGVESVDWGPTSLIRKEVNESKPSIGHVVDAKVVKSQYTLAHFQEEDGGPRFYGQQPAFKLRGLEDEKMKPKLYAHLIQSVPWWVLLYVTVWTVVATLISYLARDKSVVARWWQSRFSVDVTVATYISFAAFMLLGFFVRAAFVRYIAAGTIWGARLRSSCHTLSVHFLTLFSEGTVHEQDLRRILSHIAAIPLVLKSELRGSRDLREIKGLLSFSDIARIQCAESMVSHCVDLLRSYLLLYMHHPEHLKRPVVLGSKGSFVRFEIVGLEKMIRQAKFLRSFEIAPGFLVLLNSFIFLWFLVLPFALAEFSDSDLLSFNCAGWFTILWVPIIAYGVLGMFQIAKELQFPFGTDLNDLDLNEMANRVVSDVLFVQRNYSGRGHEFVRPSAIESFWRETSEKQAMEVKRKSRLSGFRQILSLARHTFSPFETAGVVIYTSLAILVAWAISKEFPFDDEIEDLCGLWFCSRIALDSSVQEYIGFALFLLLGFWLYESHGRYVKGTQIWSTILGHTRMVSNRIFESYCGNEWHEKDLERIAAHIAAFSVGLVARLRKEDCREMYRKLLSEEDTEQLLKSVDHADYCLDVLHHYLVRSDHWRNAEDVVDPVSYDEHWCIMYYLYMMKNEATECEELINIPMPYGYVQHLKIFLLIWGLLLPLGLVESSGWLTILWIGFIAYGVVGTVKWAEELSNPFGHDVSDLPIHEYAEEAARIVQTNLVLYKDGVRNFVRSDRPAFPNVSETKPGKKMRVDLDQV